MIRSIAYGLALILVATSSNVVLAKGWIEVSPSSDNEFMPFKQGDGVVKPDRLYITKADESFADIAKRLTGSTENADGIAHYNRLKPGAPVEAGQLLLIPHVLVEYEETTESQVKEYNTIPTKVKAKVAKVKEELYKDASGASKIDLFIGQVKVLEKVQVKRVAVGNGNIVRAEVLDSGELLMIAQSAGSSSVHLWHIDGTQSDYNIRVSENDPETRFHMETMVRMKVKMIEFRKSALGKLGIDWSDSVNGPGLAVAGDAIGNNLFRPAAEGFGNLPNTVSPFSTYFGIASSVTSRINILSSNGDAVILAEPVLSCASGGSATFLAGGELPFPATDAIGGAGVEFKSYGVKLEISPQIDAENNVRTLIETEISQIDSSVAINGVPGLLSRRAQTEVNVRSGETIVISGLLTSEKSNDADFVPGLGRIPLVGSLFKSKNKRDTVTELVIFVTPEVVEPGADGMTVRNQEHLRKSELMASKISQSLPIMD